jgi:4,5-DOPA dioxygenase extradiol
MSAPPARLPTLFVGHGSPLNAVADNRWSRAWRALAARLPRPAAVLSVSAHWFVPGSFVTAEPRPRTIHDFSGFPPELHRVAYPAPGDPGLAARVAGLLGAGRAAPRTDWGLDHGTWSVLVHLFPAADVPVVQLSLDARLAPAEHLAIGRALAPLRREGVLILGSGNAVHNLGHAIPSFRHGDLATPEWARDFDAAVARACSAHDGAALAAAAASPAAAQAHPSLDHYLPLLYAAGAADPTDAVSFPVEGFDLSSLSMRAVRFG